MGVAEPDLHEGEDKMDKDEVKWIKEKERKEEETMMHEVSSVFDDVAVFELQAPGRRSRSVGRIALIVVISRIHMRCLCKEDRTGGEEGKKERVLVVEL